MQCDLRICELEDGSASVMRHPISNTKYATGWRILFQSPKIRYHESLFGEVAMRSEMNLEQNRLDFADDASILHLE